MGTVQIPGMIQQVPRVDPSPEIGRVVGQTRLICGDDSRDADTAGRREGREVLEVLAEAVAVEAADTRLAAVGRGEDGTP